MNLLARELAKQLSEAKATLQRVRDVLDTSQTDIAAELEQAVREALDVAQ